MLVGKTPDGDRMYVEVRLSSVQMVAITEEHETISGLVHTLAFQGHLIGPHRRNWPAAGQLLPDLVTVDSDLAREIAPLWKHWHLNEMQAGCVHQGRPARLEGGGVDLQSVPPCPHTGYRYGSAWLVRPLPLHVREWATQFITDHPEEEGNR